MLFREQIAPRSATSELQIFASDVDPDAVANAREGLYPNSIESDVSPERLAKFFAKEDGFYRISAELRSSVVFTVHDVLADPPFARLDFVSCRNLLIYLSAGSAGQGHLHRPLRAARGRPSACRRRRDGRGGRRSVRRHFETAAHLPSRRRR